ncbi:MAG TPA: head GIN domain-containing protein [Prolixibacteraceae bacterium]|nr:head GIN domain-containing protein [Prolixibacteraceae bacterium]HUM89475.1 head GIN domain-containing protein [Prolixibacteraceae bacterium]
MIGKKLNIKLMIFASMAYFMFSSCTANVRQSSKESFDKEYEIKDFTKIKFEGGYNVKLIQGDKGSLVMNTTEQIHNRVNIWVDDDMLHVKTKIDNLSPEEINLTIVVAQLDYIKVEGGVFLTNDDYLVQKNLKLEVEGGAHIDMKIKADTFRTKASGGVNMEFEGNANLFEAISEGAGNIDADHFESKVVDCRVSGVGNATVYATDELRAVVEGVGKIGYRGTPSVNKQVNGIGMVYRR